MDHGVRHRYSEMASGWARALFEAGDFVTLDSETTGLGRGKRGGAPVPQFVEVAVVQYDGSARGRVLLCARVRPTIPVEDEALAVHGLTEEVLRSAPDYDLVHPLLVSALSGRRVVVYGAAFDRRIYRAHLKRGRLEDAPLHPEADRRYPWECAMFWHARFLAEPEERVGADFLSPGGRGRLRFRRHPLPGGDHTALGDARATMRLLFEMARGPAVGPTAAPAETPAPLGEADGEARTRSTDGPRRGYLRTYTPEGGGPFGRPITEPYTEWVPARPARADGGATTAAQP